MIYQRTRHRLAVGRFEAIVHDLSVVRRFADKRAPKPTTVIFDGRTIQSTLESDSLAGYDGHKRRKGFKGRIGVYVLSNKVSIMLNINQYISWFLMSGRRKPVARYPA